MSVVEVEFLELPIYNWSHTISVATVTEEIREYLPENPRRYWIKEDDRKIPARPGEIVILEHKSGSAKHVYYDIVAVMTVEPEKTTEDKEHGLKVRNAVIVAVASVINMHFRKVWDEMRLRDINIAKNNMKWIQAKLYYLDKRTGFLAKLGVKYKYEKILAELRQAIKQLPKHLLEELCSEIQAMIESREEVASRL